MQARGRRDDGMVDVVDGWVDRGVQHGLGGAVALQPIERERFVIADVVVVVREEHVQSLIEKIRHRLVQEALQRADAQRYVRLPRCQCRSRQRDGCGLMRLLPLPRVGEHPRILAGAEIAAAEGLQRVGRGDRGEQVLARVGVAGRITVAVPAGGQVVAQLPHQYGGRQRAVVPRAAADPAHVQGFAGGQQGFEEQVAIILAARTVARTAVARLRHQVEIQRCLLARVSAVIHTQQAHHAKGNRAHRHQRAEAHRAAHEALRQPALVDGLQPVFAHDGQRNGLGEIRLAAGLLPLVQSLVQAVQAQCVLGVAAVEEVHQQPVQAVTPHIGRGGQSQLLPVVLQLIQQQAQRPQQCSVQPADIGVRRDAIQRFAIAYRVAKQHAAQAEAPAVLFQRGQVEAAFLRAIQTPADAGVLDPAPQCGQSGFGKTEPLAQGRNIQQVENFAGCEA